MSPKIPFAVLRPAAVLGLGRKRRAGHNRQQVDVGAPPGVLTPRPDALAPRLFLISFDEEEVHEQEYPNYPALLAAFRARPNFNHWIDVRGYGDVAMLQQLRDDFGLTPLLMEDVLHDHQRPKMEYDDNGHFFFVSRMLTLMPDFWIDNDQLSVFTGPNYVISFQSDYDDCLEPLRARLRSERSSVRRRPVLYMAYALQDTVIDYYFPLLNQFADYIDDLEDRVFANPARELLAEILRVRKELIKVRRLLAAERDKLFDLMRLATDQLPDELRPYIRDLTDHAAQVIELADNAREALTNVAELYQSEVNNRMNKVMKVLTIISSIFIPLSFIVGVYGMNFSATGRNGEPLPDNMPELYQPHAYPILLTIMGVLVTGQLLIFWRKGWFR